MSNPIEVPPDARWTYRPNGGHPDDGYFLVSPAARDVGLIETEADAKCLVDLLNFGLVERRKHA